MTFEVAHESIEDSQPVYLYEFKVGQSVFYYTSGARAYDVEGIMYEPYAGIRHTELFNSGEDAKNSCTVTTDYDHPLSSWLRQYIPTQQIYLKIMLYEIGELPVYLEFSGAYMKYQAEYPEFKMTFSPLDYTLNQGALQKSYGLNCQHSQYDNYCGLSVIPYLSSGSIANYDAATDTIDVSPLDLSTVKADYFVGGYVELDGIYGKDRAWITSQSQFAVVVDRRMPSLVTGAAVDLIPSCKGSYATCSDPALFNNKLKFLGAPHADKVNPFDGSGVKGTV